MSNVIEFRPRAQYPDNSDPQPKFVLEIFDKPDGSGFDWHVLADEPIGEDELSDYLGDMFFTLNPDVIPEPGIFSRLKSFLSNLISKGDLRYGNHAHVWRLSTEETANEDTLNIAAISRCSIVPPSRRISLTSSSVRREP